MELSEVFEELETLLEDCGIDDAWTEWLRDHAERTEHTCCEQERATLLREIKDCESSLSQLSRYLPAATKEGDCPPKKLSKLLHALDVTVRQELDEE